MKIFCRNHILFAVVLTISLTSFPILSFAFPFKITLNRPQTQLTIAQQQALDSFFLELKDRKFPSIRIEGHTDSIGSEARKLALSQRWVGWEMEYLIQRGYPSNRIQGIGHGDTQPIGDNSTKEGKNYNRRVEIRVIDRN